MEKYDKVDWHLDGGEDYDEVIKRFTDVIEFLRDNDMLSKDGIIEFQNPVDDSTIICDEQLTERGNKFIKESYDKAIELNPYDMKMSLGVLLQAFEIYEAEQMSQ